MASSTGRRPSARVPKPTFTISASTKRMLITAAIIFGAIGVLFATASFWVESMWFGSLGYRRVFFTHYVAAIIVFVAVLLLSAAVLLSNIVIALRRTRPKPGERNRVVLAANRLVLAIVFGGTIAVTILFALRAAKKWQMWLLFLNGKSFGTKDPVFDRDIGFYIFALPALDRIVNGFLVLVLLAGVAAAFIYVVRLGVNLRDIRSTPRTMRVHLMALLGLLFIAIAGRHWLDNYQLAYSDRGVAFGASFTDVHVERLANWLLSATALLIAVILIANARIRALKPLIFAVTGWVILYVVLGMVAPGIVQTSVVEPSELRRETPYIENNIAMTRQAFALDSVETRQISGAEPVTLADIQAAPATTDNIRLWDYRVIRTTYQQLQSFAPYYVFNDVDIDRYNPNGEIELVVLSAREIDQSGLPANAQTWTNERLVYTHGYGAVVSPVSQVSPQGLPVFVVERIPPTGTGVYEITRPEVYFGEENLGWVAVNTGQAEFSGMIGQDTAATTGYEGDAAGSVQTSSYINRLLLATALGDRNILLSNNITGDSRILLHRNIVDRAQRIAPFLDLDSDPYLVIADGRLFWVIDAYTTSDAWPHATRVNGINYIRNSVKVVIDAYNGTTTFYRTAEPDPIADAYGEIFPTLFRPISEAPASIAAHFRYPERLFDEQSEAFAAYHVTSASDFYNGEDRWAIPEEQVAGQLQTMESYYVVMTLPGESEADFALIRPYVPGGRSTRQNMTSWMAGRNQPDGTSSLVVYQFPRQETVFGPRQIEARIDQEPSISAQITLWSQSGSEVQRGNLLVIPVGNSVLYVQPLYLAATNSTAALPELKRVIVASNEKVVMANTFEEGVALLTGDEVPTTEGSTTPIPTVDGVPPEIAALVQEANDAWADSQAALAAGDWAAYGEAQKRLRDALNRLAEATGVAQPGASPAATPTAEPEATPAPAG